jgi:hypothetical protein
VPLSPIAVRLRAHRQAQPETGAAVVDLWQSLWVVMRGVRLSHGPCYGPCPWYRAASAAASEPVSSQLAPSRAATPTEMVTLTNGPDSASSSTGMDIAAIWVRQRSAKLSASTSRARACLCRAARVQPRRSRRTTGDLQGTRPRPAPHRPTEIGKGRTPRADRQHHLEAFLAGES